MEHAAEVAGAFNGHAPEEIQELAALYPPDQWLQQGRCAS